MSGPLFSPHGAYRGLKAFQLAEIVYDGTVSFTGIYLDKRSRTVDQMVQAARSGRQNIAEASRASATSKGFEIKLTNVARASLEELLLDYEDFLRQHGLELWPKDHPKAVFIGKLRHQSDLTDRTDPPYETYRAYVETMGPECAANTPVTLVHKTNYLLDQLLRRLEKNFVESGGFSEKLYRVRSRSRRNLSDQSNLPSPSD